LADALWINTYRYCCVDDALSPQGFRPVIECFGFWLYIGDRDVVHLTTPKEGDGRSLQKSSYDHVAFKTSDYFLSKKNRFLV